MRHDKVLEETYQEVAKKWGIEVDETVEEEAVRFGGSMPSWPAFTDTVDACQRLAKYYHLVPLSNVDNATFKEVCEGPLKGRRFGESLRRRISGVINLTTRTSII